MLQLQAVARVLPKAVDTKGSKSTRCYTQPKKGRNFRPRNKQKSGTGPGPWVSPVGSRRVDRGRGAADGDSTWTVRAPPEVTGVKPENCAFQSASYSHRKQGSSQPCEKHRRGGHRPRLPAASLAAGALRGSARAVAGGSGGGRDSPRRQAQCVSVCWGRGGGTYCACSAPSPASSQPGS